MRRALLVFGLLGCHRDVAPVPTPVTVPAPAFNARVLSLITEYPSPGVGGYAWPAEPGTAGTTRDLVVGDTVIAHGGTGTHCVGITLEVFWRALEHCNGGPTAALDVVEAEDFKRRWFVPELGGKGAVDALVAHRLGTQVSFADAQPGDFVQAWNADNTSGHSMIFLGSDGDQIRYWSSQPWTEGIAAAESTLGDAGWDPAHLYVARAACP